MCKLETFNVLFCFVFSNLMDLPTPCSESDDIEGKQGAPPPCPVSTISQTDRAMVEWACRQKQNEACWINFYMFIICVNILLSYVSYIILLYMSGAWGSRMRALDPQELELWMFVSESLDAGNWTQVLSKRSQGF